jgi:hypothetical protein
MIIDLAYTVGLLLGFLILGIPIVRLLLGELNGMKLFIAVLSGFAISVISSAWLVALKLNLHFYVPILGILMIAGYAILGIRKKRVGFERLIPALRNSKNFLLYSIPITASGLAYILFENNQLMKARIALRTGPDMVGWISSANYLCDGGRISSLAHSIRQQLGLTNVMFAFRNPLKFPATSIYRIPSFTDQINSEFLISAHRYGLPGMQAGICTVVGKSSIYHTSVALMAISAILIATVATMAISNIELRMSLKLLAIFLCSMNINLLSNSMEGGFGQLAATAFLFFLLLSLVKVEWRSKYLPFAIFLLLGFGLSTYVDAIFVTLIIISTYLLVSARKFKFWRPQIWGNPARELTAVVLGLIAGWPLWLSLPRLLMERIKTGAPAGWDQGRLPLPANFWGFFSWLPFDGSNNVPRGTGLLVIETLVSLFLLSLVFRQIEKTAKNFIISSFVVYLLLIFEVYKSGFSHANNYPLWKMSAYISSLMILTVILIANRSIHKDPNPTPNSGKNNALTWMTFALVLALVSTLGWSTSWFASRQFSLLSATPGEKAFFDKYDVQIVGFSGANIAKFGLLGDVHYLEPSRAFHIPVQRSVPPRPIAYVLPGSWCKTDACLGTSFGLSLAGLDSKVLGGNIIVNGSFSDWNHRLSFKSSSAIADQWDWVTNSAGVLTRQDFDLKEGSLPTGNTLHYLHWSIRGDSQDYEVIQKIHDLNKLAGRTAVLSFWARQDSGAATFTTRIFQNFGTGGTPSTQVQAGGGGPFAPTTKWKKYSQVFSIPSLAGKKLGTNKDGYFWISFQDTNTSPGNLDLWGVSLAPVTFKQVFASKDFNAYE